MKWENKAFSVFAAALESQLDKMNDYNFVWYDEN